MSEHRGVIVDTARKHGLRATLVEAICSVESSMNTWAFRYEPGYRWLVGKHGPYTAPRGLPLPPPGWEPPSSSRGVTAASEFLAQKTSWGLMQTMGAVARERGLEGPIPRLCDPIIGVDIGCLHLAAFISRVGTVEGVAAYNAGLGGRNSDQAIAYRNKVFDREREFLASV